MHFPAFHVEAVQMLLDEADSMGDAEHGRLLAKAEADGVGPTFLEAGGGDSAG